MVKIVLLGSCRFEPYEFLAVPEKVEGLWNTEEGYQKSTEKFYPAIDDCDVVWVWAPDRIGEHTMRDLHYALEADKPVFLLVPIGRKINASMEVSRT